MSWSNRRLWIVVTLVFAVGVAATVFCSRTLWGVKLVRDRQSMVIEIDQ